MAWWKSEGDLDDDQKDVVRLPLKKNHLVIGPPGSGKTNLLLLRANWIALKGKKNISVLTFTSALRDFIVEGGGQYEFASDKIVTMHKWSLDFLWSHGVTDKFEGEFEDVRRKLAANIRKVIEKKGLKGSYECLLLDESQDFLPMEVNNFVDLGRTVFAVADSRQQIFTNNEGYELLLERIGQPKVLRFHYRNGKPICELSDRLRKDESSTPPMTPTCNYKDSAQSSVTWTTHASLQDQCDKVVEALATQIVAYPNEVIAVLCPRKEAVKTAIGALSGKGLQVSSNFAELALSESSNSKIFVSTIHSAKGLEFRAVHLVGIEGLMGMPHSRGLAFTGVTRAKTSLSLYHTGRIQGFLEQAFQDMYGETKKDVSLSEAFGKKK